MAIADIFQLTDFQRVPSGEVIQNVYFYERTSPAGNAEDLISAFTTDLRPEILAVQSQDLVHYLTRAISLGDVADFHEISEAGVVGLQGSGIRNEWDAYAFTLRPATRDVRPGSKRIGGVNEADGNYTNGVVTNAPMLTALHALRAQLGVSLVGSLSEYTPVIVKRVPDGGNYRLPTTTAELVAVPVANTLLNTKISHQVSRGNAR